MSKQEQAIQHVLHHLCELHHEGKTISIANVKHRMEIVPPLPALTRAVSAFKAEPDKYYQSWLKHEANKSQTEPKQSPPNAKNEKTLEQRVAKLETRIGELEAIIQRLALND
ncbi:hypothetical protein [Gayadomonas joobiniege]|uniref:hypothetical protein n=1 Tax=Gayadomonas joobiniege TaxID=1234606 RepID=UPI0003685D96|nr:hypothetical protein [Gayadomonas joobiniege]